MTDEQQTETPAKRPPGRPQGSKTKRRNAERAPTHHGRSGRSDDGQDSLENFEYRPYEQNNPLAIDPDIVRGIEREWGFSLLWVMYECNGQPFPDRVNARKRNGYADVHKGNFGGAFRKCSDPRSGISSGENLDKWADYAEANSYTGHGNKAGPGRNPSMPDPRIGRGSNESDGYLADQPSPSTKNWAD